MQNNQINIENLQQQDIVNQKKQCEITDEFVEENKGLIDSIASNIFYRGNLPVGIEFDDLVSWGLEGLIKAKNNFKEGKGSQFKTYAYYRIRGEMYDRIRNEWQYRNPVDFHNYRKRLQDKIVESTEAVIEDKDGLSKNKSKEQKVSYLISSSAMSYLLSLENIQEENIAVESKNEYCSEDHILVQDELKKLSEDEQKIIHLLYIQGLKQKEIAQQLQWSKSKVCRIHLKALERLRMRLKQRLNE